MRLCSFLLIASLSIVLATPAFSKERPNILMIAIDDLNDWIGCLGGHPDAITPHFDALAARGRNFTNAHCSVPVCSPSRVSVISGVSPTTSGSYELGAAYEEIPALKEAPTMQRWFQSHGYTTIAGGKILHHGFREELQNDIDLVLPPSKKGGPRPSQPIHRKPPWDWGEFPEKDEDMYDYQLAQAASKELQ